MKKVYKATAALALICMLGGCFGRGEEVQPTKTVYKVVEPDARYYNCNMIPLPDPETLTDSQIAQLLNDLVKENRMCATNIASIKKYIEIAKDVIEERSKDVIEERSK